MRKTKLSKSLSRFFVKAVGPGLIVLNIGVGFDVFNDAYYGEVSSAYSRWRVKDVERRPPPKLIFVDKPDLLAKHVRQVFPPKSSTGDFVAGLIRFGLYAPGTLLTAPTIFVGGLAGSIAGGMVGDREASRAVPKVSSP